MRVELRRRVEPGGASFHHDVVMICETPHESAQLDMLADAMGGPVVVHAEVRLNENMEHYVLLQPEQEEAGDVS